jgi:hypothetical protein
MAEKKNPKPTNVKLTVQPENLRVKYSTLLAYINSVVTFRFTTLGFYLAAVGIILSGTPSLEKYFLLALISISLYIIEIRNRFLKNDLGARAEQIEKKWGYIENRRDDYTPADTYIFGKRIPYNKDDYTKLGITHSCALDILYFSIFAYASIHVIILIIPIIKCLIPSMFGIGT